MYLEREQNRLHIAYNDVTKASATTLTFALNATAGANFVDNAISINQTGRNSLNYGAPNSIGSRQPLRGRPPQTAPKAHRAVLPALL